VDLILASASPRRQELLKNAGIKFLVKPAGIVEEHQPGEPPEQCVRRLAREKAQAIAGTTNAQDAVLAADTEVVLNLELGIPMGKPCDAQDAIRLLRLLRGRTHYVLTGVCLMWCDQNLNWNSVDDAETTLVRMDKISDEELRVYVASGEPMDKAGAYAIQGLASRWVSRIEGCYFNVVGLPVPLVYRMLKQHAPQLLA
jgi:septum formation protein